MLVTWFDPPCAPPDRFPSPFARTPHPIARHAAELLRARLAPPTEGKMFGVLVVRGGERIGYLAAFSGMLDGSWHARGFVPPLFDEAARDAFWPAGEAELATIAAQLDAIDTSMHTALAALDATQARELDELRARHRERRAARHESRERLAKPSDADVPSNATDVAQMATDVPQIAADVPPQVAAELRALEQASRADTAEKRRMLARHAAEREPLAREVAILDEQRRSLEQRRADRSRFYLHGLFDTYSLTNARGESKSMRALFAPDEPPGGAGDCAGPKLLGYARRQALRPIALAEFWWGPPPVTGGRQHGAFYPACRGKCGPVLGHMLDGMNAEAPPLFGTTVAADAPRVVFEDAWLVVVEKPIGLLSVPGRSGALRDSVQTRLAARFGEAHVVHRLDLDVSGLMIVAKARATAVELQRLFARREIHKRYVACLDGEPAADGGVVELALRVDLDDRPRQIHDPVHGKAARTEWRVIERSRGLTRVELFPRTGRTHQLRVHAAHPRGIGVPIVGDPLYGREAARLHLHAEGLSFVHPHTKTSIELSWYAPF